MNAHFNFTPESGPNDLFSQIESQKASLLTQCGIRYIERGDRTMIFVGDDWKIGVGVSLSSAWLFSTSETDAKGYFKVGYLLSIAIESYNYAKGNLKSEKKLKV